MTMINNNNKRQRDQTQQNNKESIDLATSLMLLSRTQTQTQTKSQTEFECKTCNRKFSSFQALGGHRASHKKPKLNGDEELKFSAAKPSKPKMHACSICGQEFSLGQALGGHMRRHRGDFNEEQGFRFSSIKHSEKVSEAVKSTPVLKRSNSKRVMCLQMDLNLTPLENDLKILFGNKAPRVDLALF